MAKRRRKRKTFKYKNQLIGLLLIIISILGLGNLGVVGKFIHWFSILLVGSLMSYVLLVLILGLGILLGIKGDEADLLSKRLLGIYLIFLGAVIFMHRGLIIVNNNMNVIFNSTLNNIKSTFNILMHGGMITNYLACGGGIVGGILAIIFTKLFSIIGMYVIVGIFVLFGLFLVIDTEVFESISEKIEERREEKEKKEEKTEEVEEEELSSTAIITGLNKKEETVIPQIIKEEKKEEKEFIVKDGYTLPGYDLLAEAKDTDIDETKETEAINNNIECLQNVLKDFGISAAVKEVHIGPTVAQYELEVKSGTRVNKITSINREIALELAKKDVRIEAPIPGKRTVGIEFANDNPHSVSMKEIITAPEMQQNFDQKLLIPLGKTIMGDIGTCRVDKMPHLLIAGTTGSGKSVCINTIICSILMRARPDEVRLALVDPKVVELSIYNGVPHLLRPVVNDPKEASKLLQAMVMEMEKRYKMFGDTGTKSIETYNAYIEKHNKKSSDKKQKMPFIVIIIDELSDLMMVAAKDVEDSILRITQKARAAGMHLIVATQRPSTEVITGLIKANIPSRIAFAVGSGIDSRTILDMTGAEKLLGKGDMLYLPIGTNTPTRIQGIFITDDEIKRITDHVKLQQEAQYDEALTDLKAVGASSGGINVDELDELYDEVVDLVVSTKKASASMIQRKFKVGYNRAGRIVDELEETGVIAKADNGRDWVVIGRQDLSPKPEPIVVSEDTMEIDTQVSEDEIQEEIEDDNDNLLDEVENS